MFDKRVLHKPLVKEAIMEAWNGSLMNDSVYDKLRRCRKA